MIARIAALGAALVLVACSGEPVSDSLPSNETIPPGTPLAEIEQILTREGGSYLIARSAACGIDGAAAPAVIAVMDGGRGLLRQSDGATVIICLDASQRATRVIRDDQ